MKHIKRTLALLLAVVLVLALSAGAFAADSNGSIKVDNAVDGKTYTLYRIFDLDSHNKDYSAFNYKVSEKWADFFKTGADGLTYVTIDEMGYVTWTKGAAPADFAKAAITYAEAHGIANDGQKAAANGTVEFTKLTLGYYLVQSDLGALCSLDTTKPDAIITEKNSEPTVDKQVKENDSYGKTNDANIGDVVTFQTTINVLDGEPKSYVLHDKMSAGLTFDKSSLTVKVNGTDLDASNYALVTENLTDDCTFELQFHDNDGISVLTPNDVVIVEYFATVNDQAVIASTGNPNETWLNYDNDQNTTHSTTRTYVWEMTVIKFTMKNDNEIHLEGAQFVLYRLNGTTKEYVVAANNKVTGWTENTYDSEGTPKATVFTTPSDGTFTISGLDSGTYYLEEIEAPAGYNKLKDPIEVVITEEIDAATNVGTATVTYNDETFTGPVKVENKTGTELPSTGGIGTTIFYIVGSLLAVGAVILLVTKKRMGKAEN